MVDKQFVATKGFIINDGDVLIVQENEAYSDGTNAGKFDVVGGRVEPGEHFKESLKREVQEEVGMEITVGSPVHVGEWRPRVGSEAWQIIGIYFHCTATNRNITLGDDHRAYRWIDPATYDEHNIIDDLDQAFEALIQHLENL